MHIIFLTHYFPPEGNAPANRTYENCRRWVAKGHKVTIVTGVPNVPDGFVYEGYKNKFFQWEKVDGIRVLRVWTYVTANKGLFRRTLNFISFMFSSLLGAFLIKKADLVIATSPQFFCGIGGYLFSRLRKLPFILEIRDIWPESIIAVDALSNRKLIRVFEFMELFLYHRAKKIIVVTESFKKIIAQKGIPAQKIFVVKNGVDLKFYQPKMQGKDIADKLGLQNKFIVSYIGTLGMAHALDYVLRTAKRFTEVRDIVFLIVGSGAERETLMQLKAKENLDNVILIERQPKELIPKFYAISDVCLVTLKNKPLFRTVVPSKIFEIMAMAKPVILGVDGESREIVEEAQAGIFVEPENEEALETAILRLYKNRQECEIFGRNGRNHVEKYFNRDILADEYVGILCESI